MDDKEELKKQLSELVKREMRMEDEKWKQITLREFAKLEEEINTIHQKRMDIWRKVAQINQDEQDARGRFRLA